MANIFDGFDLLDDNEIIENIAMLEAVNMGNVIRGYGTTVTNKSAKVINGIGKLFGKNNVVNVNEEKNIDNYIQEEKNKLINLHRTHLDIHLANTLKRISNIQGAQSKDTISASIVNSVADYLKIDDNLTVAQKADTITMRYLEKLMSSMQKELKKQNQSQANQTIKEIDKNIQNLSFEEREKLKDVLNIQDLTGREIRAVLMKTGTPALIMSALSASGFGVFMGLTTIIHAVFTTILGITLPFAFYTGATSALSFILGPAGIALIAGSTVWQFTKGNKKIRNEVLSQLIFLSTNAYGGSFVPKDKDLPSYKSDPNLLREIEIRDLEYMKLVKENNNLQNKINNLENEHYNLTSDINKYKDIINKAHYRRTKSENEILRLKAEKEEADKKLRLSQVNLFKMKEQIKLSNSKEETDKLEELTRLNVSYEKQVNFLNNSIEENKEVIDYASSEIDDMTSKIKTMELKYIILENENNILKKQVEEKDINIERTRKIKRKDLEEKWNLYYKDFEIVNAAIKEASNFLEKEIWAIERALNELHSLDDYRSISRGKVDSEFAGYDHMRVKLPDGVEGRILYKPLYDSNKKVEIKKIYKHNERFLR